MSAEVVRPKALYAIRDDVVPFHYNILWSLNFEELNFQGEVFVGLRVSKETSEVVCHAADLAIPNADCVWLAPLVPEAPEPSALELSQAVESGRYSRLPGRSSPVIPDLAAKVPLAGPPRFDPQEETMTLEFERRLQPGELLLLRVRFLGILNGDMVGLYRSSYTNAQGETKFSACTQFEPTDARRAFPCWDEPNIKATYDITVGAPKHMTTLSNMPEASVRTILPSGFAVPGSSPKELEEEQKEAPVEAGVVEPLAALAWREGQKVTRFETLVTMSTYLVAVVVGEYDFLSERIADGRVTLRIFGPIGKSHLCRFALNVAAKALLFYEEYFGIQYPLPKLDLIGIPDFGAGAMENAGLITYREGRLLLDAENASPAAQEAAARTICHELAHQWFGNYTSCWGWSQLYLNEAFARLTEFLGVDHVFPQWGIWTQFVESVYATALSLDGLANTHAIEVEVKSPAEINEVFDAISYAKGASVLKMLRGWLGEEVFMNGIRGYLAAHPYSNAVTDDLWRAIGEAAGRPHLSKEMHSWIRHPGYPVVSLELAADGQALLASQRHFLSSGGKGQPAPADTLWTIPLTLVDPREGGRQEHVLTERETEIPVQGGARLLANVNRDGFYRVLYKGQLWESLLGLVEAGLVNHVDLIGLISDTVALMNAGLIPVREFLRLAVLVCSAAEPSVEAVLKCGSGLQGLLHTHENHPEVGKLLGLIVKLFKPTFERLVGKVAELSSRPQQRLFCFVLSALAKSGLQEAKDFAIRALDSADAQPSWIKDTVYVLALRYGGPSQYEAVRARIASPDLDAEERQRLLCTVGATGVPELQEETLEWALADGVRLSELIYVFSGLASSDSGARRAWARISGSWDDWFAQVGKTGPMFGHCVGYALSGFDTEEQAQSVEDLFRKHPCDQVVRVVSQKLERIRERVFRRETQASQLSDFFSDK